LGNFGEFIVIRLSRARLAQFIAALSAMVRSLILTSGSAQAPSTNEGPFHHRRHGRARRATGLYAASMKFTSTAKAVAALVTALALSFVGLAVAALPASAHTGDLNATAACQADGTYLVTYTLTTANTLLTGSTMWKVGDATFEGTPTSTTTGLIRGPVASTGAQTITLGTTTVPGSLTKAPWAYAYTIWSDTYQIGSDGGDILLGGTCKPTQPDTKVGEWSTWTDNQPTCDNLTVTQTRTQTTTTYVWNITSWSWVGSSTTVTQTRTVTLTADQVKACHPKLPPTVEFGSQTCTVGDQGQPNLTGGQIVLGTSVGVSTKVMKDNAEVSALTGLLPGTYVVVASLTDAANSSWGNLPKDWTKNDDGTVSFSVTIGAAGLDQCTVDQPKAVITYGNWTGAPTCDNPSIYQTRDVFTSVYSWIEGKWVPGTAVKTGSETATEPMALTADQVNACTMNLKLTKTVTSQGPYYSAGDQVTYQLAPHNDGPGNALAGWSVTDILPVGMTLVSISGDGYTCDTSLTCTSTDALAADATGTPITVVAQILADAQPGTLKNVAYVSPAKGDVPETNPLVIPTLETDTSTSATDNDDQAAIIVVQVEGIVITLPNTGTTIPLTWLLAAIGIVAAGVILLGASRFNARGRKI